MLSMEQRSERDALLLSLARFDLSRLVFNKDIADPEALSLIDKDEVMFDGGGCTMPRQLVLFQCLLAEPAFLVHHAKVQMAQEKFNESRTKLQKAIGDCFFFKSRTLTHILAIIESGNAENVKSTSLPQLKKLLKGLEGMAKERGVK